MIQEFVNRFIEQQDNLVEYYTRNPPTHYGDVVEDIAKIVSTPSELEPYELDEDDVPDPNRITSIDHGEFQGEILYIIASQAYQPSGYWCVRVSYGSCSPADTFEYIDEMYPDDPKGAAREWANLALHIVQNMKEVP